MEGRRKTKVQLISELAALRQQNATLKARESKQWGAEERESNGQKIHILESITDAFYALDQQWRFTYLNRPAERLLRRTREEVFGKNAWDEFPEANTAVTRQEAPRAVAEQTRVNFEVFHPPFEKWFEVHACPSPKGLAVYFRDITRRKQGKRSCVRVKSVFPRRSMRTLP
jgi:PAS domain S-box-containing protein